MKRLLFAVACFLAGPAWADDVLYKCVDGKGAISIQSDPCPKASKEVWKRDAAAIAANASTLPPPRAPVKAGTPPPTVLSAPPVAAPPVAAPAMPPPPPVEVPAPPPVAATPPPVDPCDHARDVAAQLRDMPWLELSHDQEQRLLGWVVQQCRPVEN